MTTKFTVTELATALETAADNNDDAKIRPLCAKPIKHTVVVAAAVMLREQAAKIQALEFALEEKEKGT